MAYFTSQQFNYSTNQLKYGEMSELAEGARLEIVCAVNSGTEGSNPSLSAIIISVSKQAHFSKVSAFSRGFPIHVLLGSCKKIPSANI